MRKRYYIPAAAIVILLFVPVSPTPFSVYLCVDRTEFAYVTQFGRPVAVYDGATDAGLHFRWPWPIQSAQRLDRRLQVFDLPPAELLTRDSKGETIDKTLTIDAYVCWRIADKNGVDQFIRTVGTPEQARKILGQRISSLLGAEIGNMKMDDLISVVSAAEARARMDRLRNRLLSQPDSLGDPMGGGQDGGISLSARARQSYGIELVDIRLRRNNYPPAVREAIFERIRSERDQKVADYRSEGAQLAANIRSQAERDARNILAEARAREVELKGQADKEADVIRNQAHSKDPEFYTFLKKLEEYTRILGDGKTVLLLSSHRELFDLLYNPPRPTNGKTMQNPVAGTVSPTPRLPSNPGAK